MKRVLLAVAVGAVFVLGYTIMASLIVVFTKKYWLVWYLGMPVSLPRILYFHFFPPTAEDFSYRLTQRKILITLFAYAINVLLYSIPFYILFTVIARIRRQSLPATQPLPPLPPSFDS